MAELADALVLGTSVFGRAGSSPASRTRHEEAPYPFTGGGFFYDAARTTSCLVLGRVVLVDLGAHVIHVEILYGLDELL